MFRKLIDWNRRRRAWAAAHRDAWSGTQQRSEDGLTDLQRRCEATLAAALAQDGRMLTDREVERPASGHEYIRARIAGSDISIWIHDDTAGFDSPSTSGRFEEWDFATPEDLISAFCQAVVQASRPAT